jgi:Leucine-rich repeat (LRR) protein
LPSEIGLLINLENLQIKNNKLKSIPIEIYNLGSKLSIYLDSHQKFLMNRKNKNKIRWNIYNNN